MKNRIFIFLTFLFWGMAVAYAQTRTVSGTVTSEADGQPVVGASVLVKGTTMGTSTNADGKFTIPNVPSSARTLLVSYIGMVTKEVPISANMKVTLVADDKTLDDVVVVAYGTAKKQSLVGAQSNITSKQIENRSFTNITSALASTAPGVQFVTENGQPGSSTSIMIRGFGSMSASSAPIYVIDGAVGGSISSINPADIESISILKDAASTAIYGSSAGNGVVMITTKAGARTGGQPKFTFTATHGYTSRGQVYYDRVGLADQLELRAQAYMNEDIYGNKRDRAEAVYNANFNMTKSFGTYTIPFAGLSYMTYDDVNKKILHSPTEQMGYVPAFVMEDGRVNPGFSGLIWADDVDWEKALFRHGQRNSYTLSGTMGSDKLKSYLSLGYVKESGYLYHNDYERFNGRLNLSYDNKSWFSLGTNLAFARIKNTSPKRTSGNYVANPFLWVSNYINIFPIHRHNADGSYVLDDKGQLVFDYSDNRPVDPKRNLVYETMLDKTYYDQDQYNLRSFAEIRFTKDLKLTGNLSYNTSRYTRKESVNNILGDQTVGQLSISNSTAVNVTFNQLLNYNKAFGKHDIDALLGHEMYWSNSYSNSLSKKNMIYLGLDEMSNFVTMDDMSSGTGTYSKEGYFGRVSWGYDSNRYNASVSVRRDGTSRLSPERRWGTFWSVGAGWNLDREAFLKNVKWIDYLRLRASIGQTGNDLLSGDYLYYTLFVNGYNNGDYPGLRFSQMGNTDLKWETQTSYDLAIEFSLWRKVNATIELFNKESKDLLFSYRLPPSTGIGDKLMNLGKVRNYGVELDVNVNVMRTKDFAWDVRLNATSLKNRIVRLPEENRKDGIETGAFKYMEGRSRFNYYLPEFIGVLPETGEAIYRIDEERFPAKADPNNPEFVGLEKEGEKATWTTEGNYAKKHYKGTSTPDVYGGLSTSLYYKGFDFNVLFSYQLGGYVYDSQYAGMMSASLFSPIHPDLKKSWKQPGDVTDIPAMSNGTFGRYNNMSSDRWLTSATAMMLKTISVGYNLPRNWIKSLKLDEVRLGVTAENLFQITARKGMNPFDSYSGASDNSYYSYAKTISASLTVKF